MSSTERIAHSIEQEPATAASLDSVAHDTSDYVQAWSALLASETRLASLSLVRLAMAALVVPALALVICITLDASLVALLHRLLDDWSTCLAIVLFANLLGAYGLLATMRRWWHNLSLPRSRAALLHLLGRLA